MQYEAIIIAAIAALTTIIVAWIGKKPLEKCFENMMHRHPQRRPRKRPRPRLPGAQQQRKRRRKK